MIVDLIELRPTIHEWAAERGFDTDSGDKPAGYVVMDSRPMVGDHIIYNGNDFMVKRCTYLSDGVPRRWEAHVSFNGERT